MSPTIEPILDRIDVPGACVELVYRPAEIAELTALVAEHHAMGAGLLVCGGRTRLAQANRADRLTAALSLEALAGIDVFEPDEGVVHVRAGTRIRALRAAVAGEGWELPLDPPGPATTVGGAIASAALGPRGHAFGRVADAVLGLELVAADGTASKCGGRVVKNVTGYDLAKLYTGSFGSLAVITGAWLRLRPQPARRIVVAGRVARDAATFERARAAARATSVRAFVWSESPGASEAEIVVELGAGEAAVANDLAALERILPLSPTDSLTVDHLRDGRARAAGEAGVGLRARVLATRLDAMREAVLAAGLAVSIDLGLGVVTARGDLGRTGRGASRSETDPPTGGEADGLVSSLLGLRSQAQACGGLAHFEWLPPAVYESVDVFGEEAGTRGLAAALKQRFDARRILNPGRFVAGT